MKCKHLLFIFNRHNEFEQMMINYDKIHKSVLDSHKMMHNNQYLTLAWKTKVDINSINTRIEEVSANLNQTIEK